MDSMVGELDAVLDACKKIPSIVMALVLPVAYFMPIPSCPVKLIFALPQ